MEVAVLSQINTARTTSTYDQKVTLFETGFTDNLHVSILILWGEQSDLHICIVNR